MAHYGGPSSPPPPRAHLPPQQRPRAPIMSVPPPLTAPLVPLRTNPPTSNSHQPITIQQQQQQQVSLAAPRPETERACNEYVESPFSPSSPHNVVDQQTTGVGGNGANNQQPPLTAAGLQRPNRLALTPLPSHHHHHLSPPPPIITKQPTSGKKCIGGTNNNFISSSNINNNSGTSSNRSGKKSDEHFNEVLPNRTVISSEGGRRRGGGGEGLLSANSIAAITTVSQASTTQAAGNNAGSSECGFGLEQRTTRPSIMCPVCDRCRCASCQQPRPLPQRWICDSTCLLSADTCIDYASCLCCVKALFYHCNAADEDDADASTCADRPCGCGPERRSARWACLGAVSMVLPCLLCYWPLRGVRGACEAVYARHSRTGCRCRSKKTPAGTEGAGNGGNTNNSGGNNVSSGGGLFSFGGGSHTTGGTNNASMAALTPEKRLLDSSPDF